MKISDKNEFLEEINAVYALYSKDKPTKPVLRHWWSALENYPLNVVVACFDYHVKSSPFIPKPSDVVTMVAQTDGRPTAEEAWAICIVQNDEYSSACWTVEITAALRLGAQDLMNEGDMTAARMAFRDSYNKKVTRARDDGVPIKWSLTLGTDKTMQAEVIEKAVELGQISAEHGSALLPMITTEEGKNIVMIARDSTERRETDPDLKKVKWEAVRLMFK